MKPSAVQRTVYGGVLISIGLFGAGLVAFILLAMAGISTAVSLAYVGVSFGFALAGPLMLLAGGTLFSLNLRTRAASKIALAGAIIVTILVLGVDGSALVDAIRSPTNPAIDSAIHLRDALVYAALAVAAAIADWAAYFAFRVTRRNGRSLNSAHPENG